MATTINFWDKIADKYSKQPIADEDSYQKKLEVSRRYFNPEMEVLEFGCGTGGTALLHAPYVKNIIAIDASSKMIEIAKRKQSDAKIQNVEFLVSNINEFNAPNQSYDAILGLSILHLLEDKEAVMHKVYDMLKPGGVFISSTACLDGKMKLLKLILPLFRLIGYMPLVLKFFSAAELRQSLINSNFKIDYDWEIKNGRVVFIVAKKPS